jgi:hypothetical protein
MQRRNFLYASLAAATQGAVAWAGNARSTILTGKMWQVDIEPATLKIVVTLGNRVVVVSQGGRRRRFVDYVKQPSGASWTWPAEGGSGTIHVDYVLKEYELSLTFRAEMPGTLELLHQPAAAMGRGLILPIAEGRYVPAEGPEWHAALTGGYNDINTTEDLTLPLWGMDHSAFTLHWLLTNPFNNQLHFSRATGGLDVTLRHEFTRLAPGEPMTMTLHLGDTLLSGARRYKQFLIDAGCYQTLAEKIGVTPATGKLIGAPQIYLWGDGVIGVSDITDWPGFLETLRGVQPLAIRMRAALDAEALDAVTMLPVDPAPYEKRLLVRHVNAALLSLARAEWQMEEIDLSRLTGAYLELRQAFHTAFGASLSPDPASWGDGLSQRMIDALKAAGFDRLWIGLGAGFDGGLWHPEVIRAADEAGYLIAPYDDYMGLIAPGERPDWATSQQGRRAYEACPIIQANGRPRTGFMGTGFYANTLCVTASLKARVTALKQAAGYNSWFSDVSATGMVFDDYRPGREMTQARHAKANNDVQRWWSETVKVPLGSEVGNAVTSQGIAFAQGTETPVFGWGDREMNRDESSAYFTGKWFPPEQPDKFFAPAKTKPLYRMLHFAPTVVVPLYQAVFHGSIITTHHWTYDNLKLSDVAQDRELTQLLHNVAPTYHLSAGSLDERLPAIRRQYGVFRKLHEELALQAMTGFAWLSADKLIQQTSFADGSHIMVNYDVTARRVKGAVLPGRSLRAVLASGEVVTYGGGAT